MEKNRTRDYYRKMRAKHITRKKRINHENGDYWYFKHDGMYSKGKIFCSCGMCRSKTNNKGKHRLIHGNYAPSKNWKISDLRRIESMEDELKDYYTEKEAV